MKYQLIAYGKPALAYARDGIAEYRKRIQRFASVEERFLRPGQEALEASKGSWRIVLDERGKALTTAQWAQAIEQHQLNATRKIAFLIGPADGHPPEVREQADVLWQLAPMTMNHELALLVLWEQLYRAHALLAGHPYHRE